MDVANASMYDGASALAEALLMAIRVTRRKKVAVSTAIHPHYRQVVKTYLSPTGNEVVELPYLENGRTDFSGIRTWTNLAGRGGSIPQFFRLCRRPARPCGIKFTPIPKALFVACFHEPLAYGLFKNPGSLGADIACGEGQSFGIPQSFGGPGLGMFAAKKAYVRSMPGRLIGQTVDRDGKTRFRADPGHPGAAHPPRKSHLQHLLQPGPVRHDRRHVHGVSGRDRVAGLWPGSITINPNI